MVEVNVLFFAKGRELVGRNSTQISVPSRSTGEELLAHLMTSYPELRVIQNNVLLAINQEYIERNTTVELQGGEELAVIPPISGG